ARARAVSLQRPRRRRAREPQRDRLLAAAGEVELFALEARRIERTGIGKRLSRLADGEDSVDAKRALRLAPDVVPDDVPDAAMIDDALRAQHALAGGAASFLVVLERHLPVPLGGGPELREDLPRATRRRRRGDETARELRVELPGGGRQLAGEPGQR